MLPPAVTVCELGVAEIVKSGTAETTNVTVVVCTSAPLVAVIVRVELANGVVLGLSLREEDKDVPVSGSYSETGDESDAQEF